MLFRKPTAALLSVSMLAICAPAKAQEQVAQPAADAAMEEGETIVVTGSRLARDPNAVAPVPISTLGAADFRAAGNTDTTATLRQLPALLSSGTVADSIERGAGGVGQAVLNLRQLGANRTLVLVDGRRHVSGVGGSTAVDVSTIPSALIERVEVLTGGASAVYGADAVTGVVNYILKKDFEGIQIDAQTGISSRGDGTTLSVSGTWGKNFAEGRGNITLSGGYTNESEVLLGDRSFTANNGRANNSTTYLNPDRRFQKGDIDSATMPNFANYYRVGGPGPRTSRIAFGNQIPTAAQFATLFPGKTPTAAEQALIDRAANAPLRVIGRQPVFAISSNEGLIFRADFRRFPLTDLNNNGTNDCNESYIGWTGFGGGGCYVSNPDGTVRIFNDGVISTGQNQFGGDGAVERTNATSLTPASERYFFTLSGDFEFSPAVELFWDAKYAHSKTTSRNSYNTFFDTAYIAPDNPFIPTVLQPEADDAGGLLISRDNTDFGPGISTAKRDTYRIVGGVRGEIAPSLRYDFALNYGRTDIKDTYSSTVIADRFLAATDAVRAPNGQIVCRSDLDPNATPPQPFLPGVVTGFFTFRPGDGQCRPVNLFRGASSASAESVGFFTQPTTDTQRLEQFVATLAFSGNTESFLNLPGGAIQYAFGAEYRKEKSRNTFSDATLGILEDGTFIGDLPEASGFDLNGDPLTNVNLLFNDQARTFNSGGEFDVKEVFGEIRVPILKDTPFFYELSIEGAARYADYSTVGGAFTWNIAGTWAPIPDVRFRGSYSQAIRAPDIFELFSPEQSTTFRPSDPCNISDINERIADGVANAQTRKTNCATALNALGVDPNSYEDPLTARFSGTTGGNPDLEEEKAKTWTVGALIQPRFIPGLTLSADYYSIEISNAISAVSAQNIVDTCYDSTSFPNQYCDLFTRRGDGGFNSLRQVQINFGRIETSGVDMTAAYGFGIGEHGFNLRATVNWTEKLDRYFNPSDLSQVNPGLLELGAPEWAGVGSIGWQSPGGFGLIWRTQYVGKQAVASAIQIETIDTEFGEAGFAKAYWIHDISASFTWNEGFEIYGGINNLTDKEPYIASSAYPVSGVGRFFFLGMRAKF
jgi:outer membrane receptor protein involved in Fe transport